MNENYHVIVHVDYMVITVIKVKNEILVNIDAAVKKTYRINIYSKRLNLSTYDREFFKKIKISK